VWKSLEVGGEMESKKIVVYASQKISCFEVDDIWFDFFRPEERPMSFM
jgi:hypothetical protein